MSGTLFRGERPVLFENGVGNADLADVMQKSGDFDLIQVLFRDVHLSRHAQRPLGQPSAVNPSVDVFQV